MRIFANSKEMFSEVHRDLFEMGVRVNPKTMQDKSVEGNDAFSTIELTAYAFAIMDTADIDASIEARGDNLEWCYADFKERISSERVNPGEAYKLREEWSEFVHDGEFAYTYNERYVGPNDQLEKTIEVLKFDPATRQAVMTVYEGRLDSDNRGGSKRVPCSMYYQFMVRDGKLDVIYTMRSNDFMTHFGYDIWMANALRNHIAEQVGVKPGRLIYFGGSLHAYQKDLPETF